MLQLSIKIKDIAEAGEDLEVPFTRALLQDTLAGMDADLTASRVTAHMNLSRVDDTISVRGTLAGEVVVPCARCLKEAHVTVDVPLRITIGAEDLGAEESLEDEMDYFTHDGERIELEHVLREALILAVPMTAVCREGCKGLCTVCGGDKNERDCDCKVPDPRLEALKNLKL